MFDEDTKAFLDTALDYIAETVVIHSLLEADTLKGVFKLRSCFCGFELEIVEEGGSKFAELDCWLMQDEDVALDLSVYTTAHVNALTNATQSNFRWSKIFREGDALTVYRSEWLADEYDERDMLRIVRMVESIVAEIDYLYPVVTQLLFQGPEVCSAESVGLLLQTPTSVC